MGDPEDIVGDGEPRDTDETDESRPAERRHWVLLSAIIVLILLLCWVLATVQVFVVQGPERARFIARNVECLGCHEELIPEYSYDTIHDPFLRRQCTVCHTTHGRQTEVQVEASASQRLERLRQGMEWFPLRLWLFVSDRVSKASETAGAASTDIASKRTKGDRSMLVLPESELCWMCHRDMGELLAEDYRHIPFEDGSCTACHDPHASKNLTLLQAPIPKLCYRCHGLKQELARSNVHPPVKDGQCIACHQPHASNWKGILVKRQRDLCFSCHGNIEAASMKAVQHQPFEFDNCTGCHEPHASEAVPLLTAYQPGLCYGCHPETRSQFGQPSSHPVGLKLACADCHDPHASEYSSLVVASDNDLCYECHRSVQKSFDASRHSTQLCVKCHTPHGSDYAPILQAQNPTLCMRCHDGLEENNRHPIDPMFWDVHSDTGLNCSSTCHDPHGTVFGYMVKRFPFDRDGMCLQCHKTVGIKY